MRPNLNTLQQHISALCMLLALMFVPSTLSANSDNVQATDVYLLTAENINGTKGDYNNPPSNHQFTNSPGTTEYTYTITSMPATGFSFRIGVKGWGNNMQPYQNDDPLTINGASYTITKDCYGKNKAWKVSYKEGEYESLTITVDVSEGNRYVKITGVKNTGGGTTPTCAPGLYIAGDKYGKTGDQYIYKLQRNKDKQYYISLNAINEANWSGVQSYSTGQGIDNYKISTIGQTYHLVYIDDQGKETDYYPSTNGYTLTGSDTNKGSDKTNAFSTTPTKNWEIGVLNSGDANGGIYNFYVNTDVNGVPQNWYYEADQTKVVAYEVNESTHTTDAYLYCTRANTASTSAYNHNFFGMVSFVKDGYHSFLFADKTYGRRKNSNSTYDQDAAAGSPNAFQFSKDHLDTGIYTTEFNPTRGNYIISGDKKPSRIFIIGSALNSNLSDTFTEWNPSNATEMVYDVDEGCYKATVTLNNGKQFRFLLDHNQSGVATSLDNNFGEDSNKPGAGDDTDYNNKVQVESSSESGNNIVFNPDTKTYVIRFYVERQADKQGFQWSNDYGIYRYTIEEPAHMSTTITPPTATVAYGASLTPKVEVNDPNNGTTRTYAYTTDGSDPTIDPTSGEAKGTTKIVTYTPDAVIPTSDLGTFYMAPGNVLTFIDNKGNTSTFTGNKVTVKAQAVQTVTEGSKYRLEGNIATGNYTFETAGVQPGSNYTISVTNNEKISVNKATASVTVTNNTTGKDDDVDVYYTTDGSDPLKSTSARLVRDRKVTVYALPGEVGNAGTITVAIPGTTASASCTYDITYSTSEGGYLNYLNNSASTDKTLGGDGHVVVYVKPYSSNSSYTTEARQTYVYAYEKKSDGTYASLTPAHRVLADADKTTVNSETWYALDLVPAKDYKEINVLMGYYDTTAKTYKTSDATVANACQDMFIKFDVATGQLTEVTHAYTGDHFYTTGTNGTKTEAANPSSTEAFIYVQVPAAWVTKGNSVKVLNGTAEVGSVAVQGAAETSDLSRVCKITGLTSITDGTQLTIKPYKGSTAGSVSFTISYKNGGYYYYESSGHNSPEARLVFSADADTDRDYRSKGHRDINHVTTGDKTNYLANSWTYTPEPASKTSETKSITDNWNKAESATVNVIPSGTTISQTVTGLTAGTPYTVQMIVRGENSATGKISLVGASNGSDSKSFTGYDAAGTITTDGRVEALLSGTTNGWQKLEATANASTDGKLTISLAANGAELQLSDVTLLEKANTKGYVWTKATTSNQTTEYDLSERSKANAFSFFDRGDNKNAIVYANANTVLGMSENTYDVAIYNGSNYTMNKLALTDAGTSTAAQRTSSYTFGVTKPVTTKSFAYDRSYKAGIMSSFCLPVALNKSQLQSMGIATVYEYKNLKEETGKDTEVQFTEHAMSGSDDFTTTAGMPYIVKFTSDGSFSATSSEEMVVSGSAGKSSDGVFNGNYGYTTLRNKDANKPTLFFYSASGSNYGKFVPAFSDEEGTHMKSFRGYFDFSNSTSSAKRYVFSLIEHSSTTTGINNVEGAEKSNHGPIYTVNGQLVSKDGDYSRLPKGIYIQNNHKFVIK